ncbi:MAG TPA: heat-inducible transcriptional repressor HrcA, partial [Dongiaceae bacterium]
MPEGNSTPLGDLNERSRQVLRHIVDAYVESGEPIGSRSISRRLGLTLSPATIRNVMSDLEDAGLLYAPHTSAGRLPTEKGMRLFVHGLLEVGDLTQDERRDIDGKCAAAGRSVPEVLEEATRMLSGLSRCAGLVVAPKAERRLKHIEFLHLGPGRALGVMVTEDGQVENRIIDVPMGLPASSLIEASNYLASRLVGRTLGEIRSQVQQEMDQYRTELDSLTNKEIG